VRHVGEELGLVLRGEGQLLRLLLQLGLGELDLAVLDLEQLRLLLQLLVGAPQLLLLLAESLLDSRRVVAWFSSRSLVVRSSSCCICSSCVSDCDCLSSASVRIPAAMVLTTMPIDSVS
jgi:hypothetical protein